MALQADAQGFLQGNIVSIDHKTHARAVDVLKAIKGDTQAIRKAMTDKQTESITSATRVASPKRVANQPVFNNQQTKSLAKAISDAVESKAKTAITSRPRDEKGRFVKAVTPNNNSTESVKARNVSKAQSVVEAKQVQTTESVAVKNASKTTEQPAANKIRKVGEVATPQRGKNGQFLGKGGDSDSKFGKASEKLSNAAEELSAGLGSLTENTENIDPAIAASKEAIELVTPVLAPVKAVGALFKRDKNEAEEAEKEIAVPWYRRITDQLKKLNNKGESSGGFFSKLMSGLLGGLMKIGSLLAGLPLVGGLIKGAGKVVGGIGSGASKSAKTVGNAGTGFFGKAAKGVAGKLPLVGGLVAGGYALSSLLADDDPNLTPQQNKEQKFKGAGSGLGAMGGMALGASIGSVVPVVGTLLGGIAGGVIGGVAGEKLGEWMATVNWADVGSQITAKWNAVTDTVGGYWNTASTYVSNTWSSVTNSVGETWDKTTNYVSQKWDATTQTVSDLFKPITDFMSSSWTAITDKFTSVITSIGDIFSSIGTMAAEVVSGVKDWFGKKVEGVKTAYNNAKTLVGEKVETAKNTYNQGKTWVGEKAEAATIATGRVIGKLNKGYRHKESFEGIKGGESLAKNGTYTNEEADRIRSLKTGNFNTGVGKGLTPEIDAKITKAAMEYGLPPEMMKRIAMMESGGNANAVSSTGAIGMYQFTGGTATDMGITNRFDVDQNIAGAMKLTQRNKKILESKGIEATQENLYMMHQQGMTAVDVIKGAKEGKRVSDLTPEQQKALSVNYGYKGQDQLLSDYYERNTAKLASQRVVTSPSSTMTAGASMSTMPNAPAMTTTASAANTEKIAIPAIPAAKTQVSSDKSSNQVSVTVQQPIGQNISDRSIAQVATGGMGGYGRIGL